MNDEPLTEMVMGWKRAWKSIAPYFNLNDPLDPTTVSGKYAKTPCTICGKKGEEHTHIGNYKPEGYKPFYMIRIWRWLKTKRTIREWEYWLACILSGIFASLITNLVHWLGS